jgi:ankyrin repeat protein
LISLGANADIVDANGQTPLFYAIKQGRYETVELLIKQGVDLTRMDKKGMNALQFAKRHNKN